MKSTNKKGFTLIEIMVTITIIGILSAIVYASFANTRAQSRDKARMSALKEVELALELYKSQNGRYPAGGCGAAPLSWITPGPVSGMVSCDQYIAGLVPDYIGKLPVDPTSEQVNNRGIMYRTDTNGATYKLLMYGTVESIQISSYDDEFARCPVAAGTNCPATINAITATTYAVYGPGAESW